MTTAAKTLVNVPATPIAIAKLASQITVKFCKIPEEDYLMPEDTLADIIEERIIEELPPPPPGPPSPLPVVSTTVPAIIYDCAVLRSQTMSELLVQICCRLDRSFPKAADTIKARAEQKRAETMIRTWAGMLTTQGFGDKAEELLAILGGE